MSTRSGSTYSYKYNQDGIRISKQNGNVLTEYTLDGTKILYEKIYNTASNTLQYETVYSYDANGYATGAKVTVYNGTTSTVYNLFFRTNIQGDILSIYQIKNNVITEAVQFNYDAWGNYSIAVKNAALRSVAVNGTYLRYRGYYQDSETGFYYLNSRYYDAKMCRFINADSVISGVSGDLQGYNMFAYCFNNPVNMVDQSGNWPKWIEDTVSWVGENIVNPVKEFIEEIKTDIDNFDINNADEEKVLEARAISAYKGAVVVKSDLMGENAFSYGVIVMGNGETMGVDDVKHEYGHFVQLCLLGRDRYFKHIALPSLKGFLSGVEYDAYYSQPWEFGADLLGGVNRDGGSYLYDTDAYQKHLVYWDSITNG